MGQILLLRSFHFLTLLLSLLMMKQVTSFGSLCGGLKHQLHSAENRSLNNYAYHQKNVTNFVICGRDCSMEEDCKSFNFYECKKLCELNNATRAEHPRDFLEDQESVYFDTNKNTALLKSSLAHYSSIEPKTHPSSTEPTITHPSSTRSATHHSSTEPTTHPSSTEPTTHHSISPLLKHGTCKQFFNAGYTQSQVYSIFPGGVSSNGMQVYCDMETDGGEWIVFQRRLDGSVDFQRNWTEYKSGFGNLSGEFWLGNDNLVTLTSTGSWDLRIDLEGWDGQTAHAKYPYVRIAGEKYRLNLGQVSRTAGGSLNFGQAFTTRDNDNDNVYDKNCAVFHQGAWWFNHCSAEMKSNLNGLYHDRSSNPPDEQGIWWETFKNESLKTCSMKLRELT